MEFIDPRTFLFVANLLGILCALVLWVLSLNFPRDILGLREWAAAVVLLGGAAGLASLRGIIPDAFAILVSSALSLLGQLLLVVGLQRYSGRSVAWRFPLNIIAALVVITAWLTWGSHSYTGRIFLMSVANIVFFAVGAFLAARAKPAKFGSRFLVALFVLAVAVALWRLSTLSAASDRAEAVFDHDLIQQAYLAMFSLGAVAFSIGFILLANERLHEELEFMATRDPMTGAFNRRAFFARGEIEWARSARSGRPLAIVTSDIDFFKKVNDTYGHHVGDQVIKDYANRAGRMLRVTDVLARFGGEEFVIALPDTALAQAREVAERIRAEIELRRDAALPAYTVSIGVAVGSAQRGDLAELEALIAAADEALYQAKQGGRNRVVAAGQPAKPAVSAKRPGATTA
ncbi:MAG TPA: GGDEF domain-containing protein [Rhodocyclaceae bacterium]